jgi:hypothetical protein
MKRLSNIRANEPADGGSTAMWLKLINLITLPSKPG